MIVVVTRSICECEACVEAELVNERFRTATEPACVGMHEDQPVIAVPIHWEPGIERGRDNICLQ